MKNNGLWIRRAVVACALAGLCGVPPTFAADGAPAEKPAPAGSTDGTVRAPEKPPFPGEWTATFEDNFDGEVLDSTKWKIAQHWGAINGGAQPHPGNTFVKDGALVFKWDKKPAPFNFGAKKSTYATGEATTYKRFHQKYGYFEFRTKYDVVRGTWPAIWTMPVVRPTEQAKEMKWIYLKFDLSKAAEAKKALLKLKVKEAPTGGWFDVYRGLDDDWTQDKITWANKPVFDAAFIAHEKSDPKPGEWLTIDVTEFVRSQQGGDKRATFVLADVLQSKKVWTFHSLEGSEADRPRLVLDDAEVVASDDATVYAAEPETNFGGETGLTMIDMYGYMVYTEKPGMEIDIHEALGIYGGSETGHALHWDGYGKKHQVTGHHAKGGFDFNKWTTVGLYWEKGRVAFYVDGKQTWVYENPRVTSCEAFIILSAQLGGWAGNGKDLDKHFDPKLPLHMYVDYVKVWSGTKAKASDAK